MKIADLIPHAGAMCLLDRITEWDARSIRCIASSHRDPANPLREAGRLGAACGVEYAAQAMAAHGRLTGAVDERPKRGYLASLRALTFDVERLDDLAGDLVVVAELQAGDGTRVLYDFALSHEGRIVLHGRAAVLLS